MLDRSRFPATAALTDFWTLVPSWIDLDDAAATKKLPAGAHALELRHWSITHAVWTSSRAASASWDMVASRAHWERSG